jgi:hypothetical protein
VARGGQEVVLTKIEKQQLPRLSPHNIGSEATETKPIVPDKDDWQPDIVFSLKIMVGFFQTATSLTALADTRWPALFAEVMQYFNFLQMDFVVISLCLCISYCQSLNVISSASIFSLGTVCNALQQVSFVGVASFHTNFACHCS